MECSLAKPQADQKSSGASNAQKSVVLPTYPPHLGYGMVGGAYGAVGAGYGATGFAQVSCSLPCLSFILLHFLSYILKTLRVGDWVKEYASHKHAAVRMLSHPERWSGSQLHLTNCRHGQFDQVG